MNPDSSIVFQASIYIIPVLLAITLHEAAHGFAARLFGVSLLLEVGLLALDLVLRRRGGHARGGEEGMI